jgi:gamma-glutamyltranspeptidase/glutathione hydrolase
MKRQFPSIRKAAVASVASIVLLQSMPLFAQQQSADRSVSSTDVAVVKYDDSLEIFKPVLGRQGMVASEQNLATAVGAQILREGGNAVDAAVAVGFALAVVLPNAGNLGGGGFMLIHNPSKTGTIALDFRETAPAAAKKDMYLDDKGNVVAGKSTKTPYAVGVPGSVAGLTQALSEHGTMPLAKVIAPAIQLASEGFKVSPVLAEQFKNQRAHLERWPGTRAVFFKHVSPIKPALLRPVLRKQSPRIKLAMC